MKDHIANPQSADHQRKKWLSERINDKEFSDDNDDDDKIVSTISRRPVCEQHGRASVYILSVLCFMYFVPCYVIFLVNDNGA